MTNILYKIARISHSQFKLNYLKNENLSLKFLIPFLDSTSNFKRFEDKDDRHS